MKTCCLIKKNQLIDPIQNNMWVDRTKTHLRLGLKINQNKLNLKNSSEGFKKNRLKNALYQKKSFFFNFDFIFESFVLFFKKKKGFLHSIYPTKFQKNY